MSKIIGKVNLQTLTNMILPEDLSGYFFFDTERVQNVAERKDLSASVKGLLGLAVLDNALKPDGSLLDCCWCGCVGSDLVVAKRWCDTGR